LSLAWISGQLHDPAALFPGKDPLVDIEFEAWWVSEPVWTRKVSLVEGPRRLGRPAHVLGHARAQVVETLRYKSEGRGFNSLWCHWNFFIDTVLHDPGLDSAPNRSIRNIS
jgi:hypothetical protein